MKTLLVFLMLTGLAMAGVLPDMPMNENHPGVSIIPDQQSTDVIPSNPQPIWKNLESMLPADRANSQIEIELGSDAGSDSKMIAISIENQWNNGQYDEALAQFEDLAKLIDPDNIAIGISWRVPVPTHETALWGTDVRIGDRDTLDFVSFDIDRDSGHLFAVVGGNDGAGSHFYVNISLDNGSTWDETYAWFGGTGGTLRSMSAAVVSGYCYVGYSAADQPTAGRIRRFFTDTGLVDTPFGFQTVFTTIDPEYIKEVSVFANQEAFDNRIYMAGITSTGVLKFLWDTGSDGASWTDISPVVTDADRGLDGTFNQDNESRFLFISYYDAASAVNIEAYSEPTGWEHVNTRAADATGDYTSISAYNDIVICAYDDFNTILTCPYTISRDAGDTWNIGELGDGELPSESPDVTAKLGAGLGATFRYYTEPREQHFTYRGYDPGLWHVDEAISDRAPYWSKSAIEYMGTGNYGLAYLSWNVAPYQAAYFDMGSVGCSYILGDINGNGAANGIDVSYGVVYFKGGPPPPVSCPSCPEPAPFYAAGDVNGNCVFNGIDISYFVVYLKGGPALHSCADCPPAGGALGASIPRNSESQTRHNNSNSISGE